MKEESEQKLHDHYKFVVDKKQTPIRIDKFLMDKIQKISRSRIQKAAKDNFVFVNDEPVNSNYKVQPKDKIRISFPFEKKLTDLVPEDIPIDIIYEDEHLMVINKPAGMVVHPGVGNYTGTLVNALVYYLGSNDLPVKPENSADRAGIVHRIDKDTTGLLLIAKSDLALSHLSKQFYEKTIDREYYALVWGNFDDSSGTITGNIGRSLKNRFLMEVTRDESRGKPAVTHYEVVEDMYYVSLVKCKLETGRTHQIRVHMKHNGHPLFGDWKYQGDRIWKGTVFSKYKQFVDNCLNIIPGQALHARKLGFIHPATGEKVVFEQELPSEFLEVLERWRIYVKAKTGTDNL